MRAAGARASNAYDRVRQFADRVAEELDEVTSPHGIPVMNLDEEDSLVTTVVEVIALSRVDHDDDRSGSGKE